MKRFVLVCLVLVAATPAFAQVSTEERLRLLEEKAGIRSFDRIKCASVPASDFPKCVEDAINEYVLKEIDRLKNKTVNPIRACLFYSREGTTPVLEDSAVARKRDTKDGKTLLAYPLPGSNWQNGCTDQALAMGFDRVEFWCLWQDRPLTTTSEFPYPRTTGTFPHKIPGPPAQPHEFPTGSNNCGW